ncbi:MAG: hotdog fold thioesterase [Pseudomonadales bacterium]
MSIWFKTPTSAMLNDKLQDSLATHLGIKVTHVGEDFVVATMALTAQTSEGSGLLHGGASLSLAETLGTLGGNACIDLSRERCVCMEINANHISAVNSGLVTAMARPVHMGSRSQVWRVEIRNEDDELVCESRLTLAMVPAGH